jgi:hypothetical protein
MDKNKIDCTEIEEMVKYYQDKDEHKKHLKGYIYDSLIFRYQLARYAQAEAEAVIHNNSIRTEKEYAKRDIMRFIQILDEAIGEHD